MVGFLGSRDVSPFAWSHCLFFRSSRISSSSSQSTHAKGFGGLTSTGGEEARGLAAFTWHLYDEPWFGSRQLGDDRERHATRFSTN